MINADVCNMALGYIGKAPIVTIDDDSDNAMKCKLYYDNCRRQLLRSFEWNFARRQTQLERIDKELLGWSYVYNYPEDCLLVYSVFNQDSRENNKFNIVSVNKR